MDVKQLQKKILKEVRIGLTSDFDRNFEKKSFFGNSWPATKSINNKGSLLLRNGDLRRSITAIEEVNKVRWNSSLPYAKIHNQGGTITVTAKMKNFFWAMYYKNAEAITFNKKGAAKNKRNEKLAAEAAKWKAMALMKIGATMKIEQRQFIGLENPFVKERVQKIINLNMEEIEEFIKSSLKPKRK